LGGTGESRKKSGISLYLSWMRETNSRRTNDIGVMMLTITWCVGRDKFDEAGKRNVREKEYGDGWETHRPPYDPQEAAMMLM
jgi:hypothetical protein